MDVIGHFRPFLCIINGPPGLVELCLSYIQKIFLKIICTIRKCLMAINIKHVILITAKSQIRAQDRIHFAV